MRTYLLLLILPLAAAQANLDPPMYYHNSDLDSKAQVVFVLVVAAFLIAGFVSVCIHQCYYAATATAGDGAVARYAAAASRARQLSPSGLDPAVINSFPIFNYAEIKHLKIGKGELSCAVCVSEFEDGERLRLLTKCDHVFHPECIDLWLASHSTCPICRANLSRCVESTQPIEPCNSTGESLTEVRNQNQIALDVDDENPRADAEPRERARVRFPRPHSTGHSLVRLGEEYCERYMLRLPEELRRQVDRLDRGGTPDRWFFTMTPPFFSRTGSLCLANLGFAGKSEPPTRLPV